MDKLKIGRMSFVKIKKENGAIEHRLWEDFINNHKDYFIWFEDMDRAKRQLARIDEFFDKGQESVIYSISKTTVYSTNKIVKNDYDLILSYTPQGTIRVDLEKKMTKKVAAILLEMAQYLGAKIIINDKKELVSLEQLG